MLPAWRFQGPLGAILTSCVQAGPLGGVVCHPAADRELVYAALLDGFLELARQDGCALATVITNPFWPDRELCEKQLAPDYVLENVCQALDLATGIDGAGAPTGGSQNLRRNLRRAESGALVIDEEQSPANLEAWYAVHERRHREIGAHAAPEGALRRGARARGAGGRGALLLRAPRGRRRAGRRGALRPPRRSDRRADALDRQRARGARARLPARDSFDALGGAARLPVLQLAAFSSRRRRAALQAAVGQRGFRVCVPDPCHRGRGADPRGRRPEGEGGLSVSLRAALRPDRCGGERGAEHPRIGMAGGGSR